MKKIAISFLSVIVLVSLIYWIVSSHHSSSAFRLQKDTIQAKQTCERADRLVQNKPDSAILLYSTAIKKLESVPLDNKVRHLLASVYVDLSNVYLPQGKYNKVKELCVKALKIAGDDDLQIRAQVLTHDGLVCYQQSQFEEALKFYDQAQVIAQKINDCKLQVKLISDKAIIQYHQGNIKIAVVDFNKSLQLANKLKDTALVSETYINLGIVYTDQMDYERARKCYERVIEYYKQNKQYEDLMICYRNQGNVYYMMEKYTEAIDLYQKSLDLAKELDNKQGIAKGYHNIGEVYMLIGDYVHADNFFIQSLKIKESIGDKASMAKGYISLGDLYFTEKNFSRSIDFYQKALQIDNNLHLIKDLSKDYVGISVSYGECKQLTKAIVYCKKAVELAEKADYTYGVAEDTRELGGFYFLQKNYSQAESYYQKSIALKMKLIDQEGLAAVYGQMAELYSNKPVQRLMERKQNLQKALTYGLKAYDIAEKLKIPYLISDASNNLSEIYKKLNNYPKAFNYLEINKKTNDSIFTKSKTEALAFAEARWNNEKKQQQIANLQKLNKAVSARELAESKQHKTLLIGLVLMIVLIAFAVGLYWLYNNKKSEIRHQQQLSRISLLRLQNIRNRLSPHFIFNILNREISSEEDKEKHQEMIGLVKFLRRSLEITEQTSVSLAEELDFVKNYLQMERPVIGNDFQTCWEIDSRIETEQFRIPAMMIQIPVENALKHALKGKEGKKRLVIALTLVELGILITIQDNGAGYYPERTSNTKGTGTGLKVLYQTIQLLNAKNNHKIEFDILNLQGEAASGTKVEIQVPEDYDFEL
jgi:tetratricopeptide (TPR) repeat protein